MNGFGGSRGLLQPGAQSVPRFLTHIHHGCLAVYDLDSVSHFYPHTLRSVTGPAARTAASLQPIGQAAASCRRVIRFVNNRQNGDEPILVRSRKFVLLRLKRLLRRWESEHCDGECDVHPLVRMREGIEGYSFVGGGDR